ncbi:MAG: hypothetical protein A3J10_02465 [Candidatus Sungbacteria bacterium RIFCSPLOWO2_02_FULL_54_10]|uniref:Type II secretion system protein GspF domain-containing protein n=2 Tax=Candidatus Sungiibacteriota TaxID=1817917 RepID=A0A1G2L6X2_9BACT|nr:MAG: hypothetical protein A2679_02280 [Candidatus Sungbacteria bacterium RIFCSPHIGHO2_01_FULL_54_26]OHA03220.1 MAG: hypothetical protein A3C92_01775 [Candidatus Sungbacteria bacterium RIFCSPHIGHO2_02_FULL_53_17]OHA06561.1 MAG: hypothetical protein A3B34_01475 [Candidatus Sungbacteria bacterium RIFCSPLOWO2_01_FULL_54_21]OHA13796.1 MAG: hypothetical protein A3J10_02465 [Candidatus Sungbacteria bacterium RIFCSPLOWO2_02_FULL_54_10]
MVVFVYSAADQTGKASKGEREAADAKALAVALRGEGLLVLDAAEKKGIKAMINFDVGEMMARVRPVSLVEKMFFARNLGVMVGAGLPLTRALDALRQEANNPKFKRVIADINAAVVKGRSFAEGLRLHEKVFGDLVINMVEVGETTGKLTLVLKLLANQMKRDHTLKKRVRGAMMYPAIIMIALTGVGTLMMYYVVPTIAATIKELGVPLPLTTRIIMGISDLLVHYGLYVAIGVTGLVWLAWRLLKTEKGRRLFDTAILRVPIFGPLVRKFNTARFCRTLSYLSTSGVPIMKSLDITGGVLGNALFRDLVRGSAADIQKGKPLATALGGNPRIFQPLVIQMIAVGEETGKIAEMLLRLALFFEEEVNGVTKNLSTIVEPILMIVIGIAVGFFAVSMLQPIYGSLGSIGI